MTPPRSGRLAAWLLAASLVLATNASAEWLLTPYAGAAGGGAATGEHATFGASVGYMGARIIGLEIDASHAPDLTDGVSLLARNRVTTAMVNLVVGVPLGTERGLRPYVSGGAGLMRTRLELLNGLVGVDNDSVGVNAGAGVYVFVTDHVGLRADGRYFRTLDDTIGSAIGISLGRFDYWRGTLGVSFRF